jgi:ABC-2 type transport system ATP-binding protein
MEDFAIKVENVSKVFKLPHEKNSSIKSVVVNSFRRKKGYELQKALKDVSFEVKKGEFFGIVGRNGSGKSTLLKLLAGIYSPTAGRVEVNGRLTPFIELGVGFNPELTGRENIFLNGALLGFNRKEMRAMYRDIVDFAELEKFMDQKLKNYSSGMQVRLAFSIAIRAQSDILLIDEVLAVGDEAFQRKSLEVFDEYKKQKKTIILVTHDMGIFEKYCTRGILINAGKIIYRGEPFLLSAEYKMLNSEKERSSIYKDSSLNFDGSIGEVLINGESSIRIDKEDLDITISITPKKNAAALAGISILRGDGVYIAFHNSKKSLGRINLKAGVKELIKYRLKADQFLPGAYTLDVALYDSKDNYIDLKSNAAKFVVTSKDETKAGIINLKGEWSHSN